MPVQRRNATQERPKHRESHVGVGYGLGVLVLIVLVSCLFSVVSAATPGSSQGFVGGNKSTGPAGLLTLDFKQTDIRDVLRAIALQQGINLVSDPDVTGQVTIRLSGVSLDEGLRLLLSSYGWVFEKRENIYRVRRGIGDVPLRVEMRGDKLTIEANGAPLEQVLLTVASTAGVSLVPDANVTGTLHARLNEVSFEGALSAILKGRGFDWRKEAGVYRVEPVESGRANGSPTSPLDGVNVDAASAFDLGTAVVERNGDRFGIRGQDVELRELLYRAAGQAGVGLILHNGVAGNATVRLVDVPAAEVVPTLARANGYAAVEVAPNAWWVGSPDLAEQASRNAVTGADAGQATDRSASRPFSIRVEGGLVWLTASDAPLPELFQALSIAAGFSLVVDEDVTGRVRASLQGIPVEDVMAQIALAHRLTVIREGAIVRISVDAASRIPPVDGKAGSAGAGSDKQPGGSTDGGQGSRRSGSGDGISGTEGEGGLQPGQFSVEVQENLLSVRASDASVRALLLAIADRGQLDLTLAPSVQGDVSIQLDGVDAQTALSMVVEASELTLAKVGHVWNVSTRPPSQYVRVQNGLMTLRAEKVEIRSLLGEMATAAGRNMLLAPDVQGDVTLVLQNVPWETALATVLKAGKLRSVEADGVIRVYASDEAEQETAKAAARPLPPGISLLNLREGRLTAELRGVQLGVLLRELADRFGTQGGMIPVVADRDVATVEISGSVAGLPLAQALSALLAPYRLEMRQDGSGSGAGYKVTAVAPAPPYTVTYENGLLAIRAQQAPMREVLREIGRLTGVTLVVPDGLLVQVNADMQPMPPALAVRLLLEPYGFRLEQVEVGEGGDPAKSNGGPTGAQAAPTWHGIYRVIPPDTRPVQVTVRGQSISVEARDVELSQVLDEVAKRAGVNMVVDPGSSLRVSVSLRDLPLLELLDAILTPYGRVATNKGSYFQVGMRSASSAGGSGGTSSSGATGSGSGTQAGAQATSQARKGPALSEGVSTLELAEDGILAEFQNARLASLLDDIARNGGPRFTPEREISNDRVTGKIEGGVAEASVRTFLQANGYMVFKLPKESIVRSVQTNRPLIHMDEAGLFYLEISGADLTAIVREMANKAGKSIVVYSYARTSVNNVQLYGATFEQALEFLFRGTTFTYIKSDETYLVGEGITPRPDSPEMTASKLIRLQFVQTDQLAAMLPPSIPIQNIRTVPGQNAVVVFGSPQIIAKIEEFIAAVDVQQPAVRPVVLPLRHVKPEEIVAILSKLFPPQAFHFLQAQNALVLSGSADVNRRIQEYVAAMDVPEMAVRTAVLPLQHIRAEDAKRYLPSGVDAGRILVIDEQNALVVSGRDDFVQSVKAYLAEIDIRNPQIVFEVMVVELNDRNSSQLGLSGATSDGAVKFDLLSSSPFTLALGSSTLAGARLTATLSTLVQEGKAKLLANPRIATLNGREASFNVLTTSRYWDPRTVVEDGNSGSGGSGGSGSGGSGGGGSGGGSGGSGSGGSGSGGSGGSNTGTTVVPAFRTIETGIRLRLKPWVSAAGEITIDLQPEISDSAGASAGSSLPSTNDRSVHTTIRVRDGQTIVIGGLIQRTEHRETAKIPLLGDLPIIGRLFQSENVGETETEFVIAITCRLVDSLGAEEQPVVEEDGK